MSGKVLGVHALADGAGEIMLAATLRHQKRHDRRRLADTWAPYLTMSGLRIVAGLFRNQADVMLRLKPAAQQGGRGSRGGPPGAVNVP